MPKVEYSRVVVEGDCVEVWPAHRQARMIFADPPYGIDYQGHGFQGVTETAKNRSTTVLDWLPIQNDKKPFTDWLPTAFDRLEDGGAMYLCTRWDVEPVWREAVTRAGFTVKQRLTWHKKVHGKGDLQGTYATTCEDVLFAVKGRHILNRRSSMLINAGCVPTWQMRHHPHQKPERLVEILLRASTKPGDLVVDPFAGSGTTGIVCKATNRRFLGIEIDPVYAELARRRIA